MSKQEEYEHSQLYRIRHSTAHIMAEAVLEKFPSAKIAIGPAIEDGFYYDFDLPRTLTPEDLIEIEARMKELIREGQTFVREEITAEQAKELFKDQPYKLELIEGLEQGGLDLDASLSLWERGEQLAKRCEEHLAGARRRVQEALDAEPGDDARG